MKQPQLGVVILNFQTHAHGRGEKLNSRSLKCHVDVSKSPPWIQVHPPYPNGPRVTAIYKNDIPKNGMEGGWVPDVSQTSATY